MFSEMVRDIEQGILPDVGLLRGRCHAAVTKKLALVRLPPAYWERDPKRNPDTGHLLWAILLLQDPDLLEVVKGVILIEQAEGKGSRQKTSSPVAWTNSWPWPRIYILPLCSRSR